MRRKRSYEKKSPILTTNDIYNTSYLKRQITNSPNSSVYSPYHPYEDRIAISKYKNKFVLVGLYDGHSGSSVVNYTYKNFLTFLKGRILKEGPSKKTFGKAFIDFNIIMRKRNLKGGTTVTILYISKNKYLVANLGDSPAYIISKRCGIKMISEEHDYDNPKERARTKGYWKDKRIYGIMLASRGFGDFDLEKDQKDWEKIRKIKPKNLLFTAVPSIKESKYTNGDMYFLITSDGVTDSFTRRYTMNNMPSTKQMTNLKKNLQTVICKRSPREMITNIVKFVRIMDKNEYHDDISVIVVNIPDILKGLH